MLSIGKIAVGQADYYLEQADGPTSRTRAVSTGVEDYYLGGPESAGEWISGGASLLELRAEVGGMRCMACWPVSTPREGCHSRAGTRRGCPASI